MPTTPPPAARRGAALGRLLDLPALATLTPDGRRLFVTRLVRMFAYGALAVVLALYLAGLGLTEAQIGLVLTLTLAGDAVVSLGIATAADRAGRRRMLLAGAWLMIAAGALFAVTTAVPLLVAAAILGTLSPSGAEVGPFSSIEQAILPQTAPPARRTGIFAWYNLAGSVATALGALSGGAGTALLQGAGLAPLTSYRLVFLGYTLLGGLLVVLFLGLSPAVEAVRLPGAAVPPGPAWRPRLGLHRSRAIVFRLARLFMVDAFAGGLVVQSLMAYWFHLRFGVDPGVLGGIFFGANILAGVSALVAARLAARFGLINTMVWTHIPSNVLLILVPLMPTLPLAIAVLLARFSISQMDVPTRQSYTMAVVAPDERSAAAGLTTITRTAAVAVAPSITGVLLGLGWWSAPFILAGGLKIAYDLALWRSFRALPPPEEADAPQ